MTILSEVGDLPDFKDREIIIDTESTGLNTMKDVPFLAQIQAVGQDKVYAIPWDKKLAGMLAKELKGVKRLVGHNLKFDCHMMAQGGVPYEVFQQIPLWCTLIAETLIDDLKPRYNLNYLGYLHFDKPKNDGPLMDWMLANTSCESPKEAMGRLIEAPIELVAEYGVVDVEITELLYSMQKVKIRKPEWRNDVPLTDVMALEMDVLPTLVGIERRGVPIDTKILPKISGELHEQLDQLMKSVEMIAGFAVNSNSGAQMEKAFKSLGLPVFYNKPTESALKKLKEKYPDGIPDELLEKGNPSFKKEIMEDMDHEFPRTILDVRSVRKMLDTFIDGMEQYINPHTKRIHANFNQTRKGDYGVGTGRLSCNDPNLQQIPNPKRGNHETAKKVRSLFALKDKEWVSGDWDQFEDRIFGHFADDPELTAVYKDNPDVDFHGIVATMCEIPRGTAKQINLGGKFGMGQGLMAKKLGLPYTTTMIDDKVVVMAGAEAQELFQKYHTMFPKAKELQDRAENLARKRGYIKTLVGRKIRFKHSGYHKASGLIFQGNAADIMKQKLVELEREFDQDSVELILPVHDEFNLLVAKGVDVEKVKQKVKAIMEDVPQLKIPIRASVNSGANWYEASREE